MNAAAKAISQNNVFNGRLFDMHFSKELALLFALLISILLSCISIIYITNVYRFECSQLQQLEQQEQQLKLLHGQLILEQASLTTPARIESLAKDNINMRLPSDQDIYILRSP